MSRYRIRVLRKGRRLEADAAAEDRWTRHREDVAAALPYSDADVKSVARRLYEQRSAASNGDLPNVVDLASDFGRSKRTVANWVEDRVAKKQADIERKRAARIVAVHAFRAAGLRQQRISDLLGISQRQVSSNCQLAITANLADSAIVTDAHSLIHMSLGQGATQGEMEAARDWLIAQTDPDYLTQRERARRLTALSIEFVDCADRWRSLQLPDSWKGSDEARADVLRALEPIETCIAQVKRRLQ